MLDIGWWELAVVAMIALIVIGPKDLPRIMRVVGRWAGKARAMAREFQSSVDDMVRESEVAEITKEVESVATFDVTKELDNAIDPTGAPAYGDDGAAPSPASEAADTAPADTAPPEPETQPAPPAAAEPAPADTAPPEPETQPARPAAAEPAPAGEAPAKTQAAG